MDNSTHNALLKRNKDIINILLEKVKDFYGWVDIIAFTGSFATGDYHEKSDLDIFIVTNDERAKVLNRCFILGDVGFDIYSVDMNHLREAAEYHTPHLSKLLSSKIIYSSPRGLEEYNFLRHKAEKLLSEDIFYSDIIMSHLKMMLTAYEELKTAESRYALYMALGKFTVFLEYVIYTLNRKYITGVRSIPREIRQMKYLPQGFAEKYGFLPSLTKKEEIIKTCTEITSELCDYLLNLKAINNIPSAEITEAFRDNNSKLIPTKENFRGVYEEFISNYRHKMHLAADTEDKYYSFMNMFFSQLFLDEMYESFHIPEVDLISSYDPTDLRADADIFDEAAKEFLMIYDKIGLKVNHYSDTEELKNLYK